MYMTNDDFRKISDALMLLPSGKDFEALDKEKQDTIIDAQVTMGNLLKKKKRDNKRIAEYIAEKRKQDADYAR